MLQLLMKVCDERVKKRKQEDCFLSSLSPFSFSSLGTCRSQEVLIKVIHKKLGLQTTLYHNIPLHTNHSPQPSQPSPKDPARLKRVRRHIAMLHRIRHPNVLLFMGCATLEVLN